MAGMDSRFRKRAHCRNLQSRRHGKPRRHRSRDISTLRVRTHRRPCDQLHPRTLTVIRRGTTPRYGLKTLSPGNTALAPRLRSSPRNRWNHVRTLTDRTWANYLGLANSVVRRRAMLKITHKRPDHIDCSAIQSVSFWSQFVELSQALYANAEINGGIYQFRAHLGRI